MRDYPKIYHLILADILERLKEKTISRKDAIQRITEVSMEYYWYEFENDGSEASEMVLINYLKKYYPQFLNVWL